MVTFHTQDSVHILEQHNNPLSQTLQYNRIYSLFSHKTNSKVLLLPFIHYHIESTSISVVIYNIYFSVGLLYNIDFLVFLICALSVVSKYRLTSYSIRRLGRPCGRANISSRYCPGNGSGHTLWLKYKRTIITNVTLKHTYSRDSHTTPPPSTKVL